MPREIGGHAQQPEVHTQGLQMDIKPEQQGEGVRRGRVRNREGELVIYTRN